MPARTVVFDSPWCRLVSQSLLNGEPYYMLEVPDYVCVVARTSAGGIMLVRQHRVVAGRDTFELPSGHVDDGEMAEAAARRELLEETGMVCDRLELLGVLIPDVGRLLNRMWCYFAADVRPAGGEVELEDGVVPVEVSEPDVLRMAADGRIDHALNLSALFLAVSMKKLSFG